jgi:hypothetical protein
MHTERHNHLEAAGRAASAAHDEWLAALRAETGSTAAKNAQKAGDAAWDQAVEELRWHGIRKSDGSNVFDVHDVPRADAILYDPPIDFAGLKEAARLHRSAMIANIVQRLAVGFVVFAAALTIGFVIGCFTGYDAGRDLGGKDPAAILESLEKLDAQQRMKGAAK